MEIDFVGKIAGLEFLDKKTKKVIYKVDYSVFPDTKPTAVPTGAPSIY